MVFYLKIFNRRVNYSKKGTSLKSTCDQNPSAFKIHLVEFENRLPMKGEG